MKQAEKGIRFISPDYRELFRIADGDKVRIVRSDGEVKNSSNNTDVLINFMKQKSDTFAEEYVKRVNGTG